MRVAAVRTAAIVGVGGAVAGCLVALTGNWWAGENGPTSFGWYAYSPLPNATMGEADVHTDWWRLLWPAAVVGAVVGVIAMLVWSRLRNGARGRRVLLMFGPAGVVLGLAVGGTLASLARSFADTGHPRRYVDYLPSDGGPAYESALSIRFDADPSTVWTFLGVCAVSGLAIGVLVAAVITVHRRRGISRGTAGAA